MTCERLQLHSHTSFHRPACSINCSSHNGQERTWLTWVTCLCCCYVKCAQCWVRVCGRWSVSWFDIGDNVFFFKFRNNFTVVLSLKNWDLGCERWGSGERRQTELLLVLKDQTPHLFSSSATKSPVQFPRLHSSHSSSVSDEYELSFADVTFGGQMTQWDPAEVWGPPHNAFLRGPHDRWSLYRDPSICVITTSLCVCHSHRFRKLCPVTKRLWSVSPCPSAPVSALSWMPVAMDSSPPSHNKHKWHFHFRRKTMETLLPSLTINKCVLEASQKVSGALLLPG